MTRPLLFLTLSLMFLAALAGSLWFTSHKELTTQAGAPAARSTGSDHSMEAMPGMEHSPDQAPAKNQGPGTETTSPNDHLPLITVSPERLHTIGVTFETVQRRPLEKVIRTIGRVEIDERRLERVNVKFAGWIDTLYVSAIGDHVKKGQMLFTIYSPDLVATQEEYLLALQSIRELGGSEFPEVSRGANDLLEATRRRFQLWDITDDHIRDLERTGTVLKALPIHSPMSGTVIRMEARKGTYVSPGTELYLIADLSHIWILADIYEYELPFIKVGQEATVTLSYDPGTKLHGHVGFIYPTMDPKTRTAKVRFELDNLQDKLKPDMYANVELHEKLGTQLAIPDGAMIDTGTRQVVFVDRGHGSLEPREVQLTGKIDNAYVVQNGLQPGERVVTSAAFLIDSESQLRSALGMMSMPGMEMGAKPNSPSGTPPQERTPMEGMPGMQQERIIQKRELIR